jgi:glycosyltransferase involved in cell wall biosynthesis
MINDHIHFGGGGDALFRLERRGYEEAGHEVFTFSHSTEERFDGGENDYVHLESKRGYIRKALKFTHDYSVETQLRYALDESKPDVIRVHLVSKYPTAVYRALSGQVPVIQTLHGPSLFCATSWGCLRKDSSNCELGVGAKCALRGCISPLTLPIHLSMHARLSGLVRSNVSLFHVLTEHLLTTCRDLGYGPLIYIPPGVSEHVFDAVQADHSGPPTVLFVGALDVVKGVDVLVRAFEVVAKRFPNAELLIAGVGRLEQKLKRMVDEANLGKQVRFLGFVDNQGIADLYRHAQVLAVPSVWKEQFGLVGPEALACGVPCVGSNIGGIPEWLRHDEWGYLVEPRDVDSLADRIAKLLGDKALRIRFGARGREYVRATYAPARYKQDLLNMVGQFGGH